MQNDNYYSSQVTDEVTLNDRLRDYYEASDFVEVMNIDNEPLTYQYADPKNEQIVQPAPHLRETYYTAPPVKRTLQPGEVRLAPAFEADAMIVALIKQMTSKTARARVTDTVRDPVANWNDPQMHKELLPQIIQKKRDFVNEYNQSLNPISSIDKDLGLEPEQPARPGRSRKTD